MSVTHFQVQYDDEGLIEVNYLLFREIKEFRVYNCSLVEFK